MGVFGASMVTVNQVFCEQISVMCRAVDDATGQWTGSAAAAAANRALADSLAGNHIGTAVEVIADRHTDYGARLADIRITLLNTVDHDAKGMNVGDNGAVTAPIVPGARTGRIQALLLQAELNQHAHDLQGRIRAILDEFETVQAKAASELADATAQLTGLLRDPSGGRLQPKVESIVDGVGTLPTNPAQLREFWSTLTPAEKDALYQRDPQLGNHDGIPQADRDYYNRRALDAYRTQAQSAQAAVGQLEQQHPDWAGGHAPAAGSADYPAWLQYRNDQTQARQAGRYTEIATALHGSPPRYLCELDADHVTIAVGDPDTATKVILDTPSPSAPLPTALGRAVDAYHAAVAADPSARTAVLSRIG
jgi:hypothetical protein